MGFDWDPQRPSVTEDVPLDLGHWRGGSVVYSPITGGVSFRLEMVSIRQGRSSSEAARVLGVVTRPVWNLGHVRDGDYLQTPL